VVAAVLEEKGKGEERRGGGGSSPALEMGEEKKKKGRGKRIRPPPDQPARGGGKGDRSKGSVGDTAVKERRMKRALAIFSVEKKRGGKGGSCVAVFPSGEKKKNGAWVASRDGATKRGGKGKAYVPLCPEKKKGDGETRRRVGRW